MANALDRLKAMAPADDPQVPTARRVRVKPVRQSVMLPPTRYNKLGDLLPEWQKELALTERDVNRSQVFNELLAELLESEVLSRVIKARLVRSAAQSRRMPR